MTNPRNRWALRALLSSITVTASLYLGFLAQPAQAIQIISPKPKATLRGTVQVLATPTAEEQFNYAMLLIDASGQNLTNLVPIRFQLDTTKYEDGQHNLQVELSDGYSTVARSKPIPVFILNTPSAV